LFGADGGGNKPSADLINLENIALDLTDNRDDQTNVDFIFKKKVKVI
jgi:hypothetical protein